ncbi:MAG: hypothetical protein NWE89_02650 [Candidatus Bathyarchaeota archaeon]|nr:hypothetical protein [Candidatus Bathyarchaeota archaeon]
MQYPLARNDCIKDHTRYADSVVILAALYRLYYLNVKIGKYVGVELPLHTDDGEKVEPDFIALYDDDKKGIIYELKWSLPHNPEYLGEELKELKKYFQEFNDWRNTPKKVEGHDVVLICNVVDINRIITLIQVLCNEPEFQHLRSNNFSIWGWSLIKSKDPKGREELRLERFYGKTGNKALEELLDQPAGILVSEDVLRFIRWNFFFIKQKPPPSYIISVIIQHILNPYPSDPWQDSITIDLESIVQKCEGFFSSWKKYDRSTKQVKRNWIHEALRYMHELDIVKNIGNDIYEIPIPLYRKRLPLIEALCKDLYNKGEERRKSIKTTSRKRKKVEQGPLDRFLERKRK